MSALVMLWAQESFSADYSFKYGDIDTDSSLTWHDIYTLVRHIAGQDSVVRATDLDSSGAVDFRDVLAHFRLLLSLREQRSETPQFVIVVGQHMLDSPKATPGYLDGEGRAAADYRFISDRPLREAELALEEKSYQGVSGRLTEFHLLPDSSAASTSVSTPPIHWLARAVDSVGNTGTQSGVTEFSFLRNIIGENAFPLTGLPLGFPLVLHGPWQRFMLRFPWTSFSDLETEQFIVDLNPSGTDSVVFSSLDTLARGIMASLIERYPAAPGTGRAMIAGPATPYDSSFTANRLRFYRLSILETAYLVPLDYNEHLLQQLGFPDWYRNGTRFVLNKNYRFPDGWLDEYMNR
ncbi:hypothetical protein LLH00_12595 [bacterium]|nr:hypothetical protein [bacterium]